MIKRGIDILASAIALALLSWLILGVALAVRVLLGSPVLFRQTRPGLHSKPFRLAKFRTMRDAIGIDGVPLPDNKRLTRFGRLLRATSLDELPQLWNVLRGDMSLVGPRPLLMAYLPRYSTRQSRRHVVKPGMTGWSQVNGRNAISWPEKLELDIWYVDNRSLAVDFKIMLMTLGKIVRRKDINASDATTMPEFLGEDAGKLPGQ